MQRRGRPAGHERSEPPTVVVRHDGAAGAVLREVRAGAEEEGVPTRVEGATGEVTALAYTAAVASPLEVGIGIDATGAVAVHHTSLPPHSPIA